MPIVLKIENSKDHCVAVWQVTETLEELLNKTILSEEEKTTLNNFKNESRQREWLAVRTLLQELRQPYPIIQYKENGKPYLTNSKEEISISHSGAYIAIALSSADTPGVDIEHIHPKIKRIAERFVSEKEKEFIKEETLVEQLYIVWACKEVLYKIHPKGMLSFKNNLLVLPFELKQEGSLEGHIIEDNSESAHKIFYRKIADYILVYT